MISELICRVCSVSKSGSSPLRLLGEVILPSVIASQLELSQQTQQGLYVLDLSHIYIEAMRLNS